ncbi:ABC transporter ATP-binding protein [Sporosarcina sp. G11-34]|uniref:ABC transporter ATP-binding protein n=1 Tax=Sporosarcina sp. G11-34 TaxID=2849605 RepID=UPI0022A99704|nr:ABC transporter ATP-binding protein [Sporosarcina sp. G11-34]MCZ2256970.1 ABC transporter ATP-binding protein [Sporosarcina sp. G11-34]
MSNQPVLDIGNLRTYFYLNENQVAKAVDGVSFTVYPGETVALVGESGSGKSITALSIMQLINKPGRIVNGRILMKGQELLKLKSKQMSTIRGNKIAMIFQEPMTALNPVYTIGNQITEIMRKHKKLKKRDAELRAIELLKIVGIPRPEEIMKEYPHQLSGGMRQRVMIAMAISCNPELLIADEPTTALDVTIQAQILDLLAEMQKTFQMAILLITHDLGVVYEYTDRVMVMYGGQIVEQAPTKQLLRLTKHPYTQGLLASLPNIDEDVDRLGTIKGTVPPAYNFPKGCRFATRCPYVMDKCKESNPELKKIGPDHFVRCFLYEEGWNYK